MSKPNASRRSCASAWSDASRPTGSISRRARALARRHDLPLPVRVEWSDRQQARWGSCDPADGVIRVSRRLAAFPIWVLDYVLVHELAHLAVADHGPRFQALVARYPAAERAVGFLIAKDLAPDEAEPDRRARRFRGLDGDSNGEPEPDGIPGHCRPGT